MPKPHPEEAQRAVSKDGAGRTSGLLGLLALLTLSPAASAKPPLDYQEPPPDPPAAGQIQTPSGGQVQVPIPDRLVGPGPFRRLPSIDESLWVVVLTSDKPYWQIGKPDPVLTNACRLRDFISQPFNRLVARFNGDEGRGLLQVVLPDRRHLLIDRRGVARPDETYYFLNSGETNCEVWFQGRGKPRRLNSKDGTSLPTPNRSALKKKLQLIDSWPKPPEGN